MKTVTQIELKDDKNNRRRFLAAVVFLLIGAGVLVYAFMQLMGDESGWQEITVSSVSETSCADDFVLLYELGQGEVSATAENRALSSLYTDACVRLYQLFNVYEECDGVTNLCSINAHPGEALAVDSALYDALALAQESGTRAIYLAPIYERIDSLFYCQDDFETADFDPAQNEALADFCAQAAEFANDADSVTIELLGNHTVRLFLSQEYRDWLDAEGVTRYVDFYWMKNAFLADALADILTEAGYTRGLLSSADGFVRNLGADETCAFNLYDREGSAVYDAGTMEYQGALALVSLHSYPLNAEESYFYEFSDGTIRTAYYGADGCEAYARDDLVAYSRDMGCGEVLLSVLPFYVADGWDDGAPARLLAQGIHCIYGEDGTLYYNDAEISITGLYERDGTAYRALLRQGDVSKVSAASARSGTRGGFRTRG